MVIPIAAALTPVLLFLGLLVFLDSFKLVAPPAIWRALAAGAIAAALCLPINGWLVADVVVPPPFISRYVAPLLEESVKVALVAALVWRRAGFLVDAAILGFAIGTGFALVENVHYLWTMQSSSVMLWMVRGFGTAVLHGATAGVAAILTQRAVERGEPVWRGLLAGWAVAVAVHSGFNHFLLPPVVATLVLLVSLPPLVLYVFERSERATRTWVHEGMDLDLESLNALLSSDFGASRAGAYLRQLQARFAGPVVADMFCLLRLDLELAIRAKALLMARDAGVEVPIDASLAARLEERRYLRASIGRTGLLALRPLQAATPRQDWHEILLKGSEARRV